MKLNNAHLATGVAIFLGALLRVAMATHLGLHIDEPASILAAHQVAETGLPFLPSGVLYLQGTTLSYLLAPIAWMGLDGPAHLALMRTVPVLAGLAVLPVVWKLVWDGTRSDTVAAAAVWMVALDPVGVQWSVHLRPYSLLELFAVLFAWRSWKLLQTNDSLADRLLVPLLFALGCWTHLLMTLLFPGMLCMALWKHGRALLSTHRHLLWSGAACLLGPGSVVVLNRWYDVTSASASDGGGSVAFVGNHVLNLARFADPSIRAWQGVHLRYGSVAVYTSLFLVVAGVLATDLVRRFDGRSDVRAYWAMLGWSGLVVVAALTNATEPRYVLHLHLFTLLAFIATVPLIHRDFGSVVAGAVTSLMVWGVLRGNWITWQNPLVSPDYQDLHRRLQISHVPGQPILTPLPAISWWYLPQHRADLVFLAGAEDSVRPGRYTHPGPNGPEDFWLGVPSVVSIASYCALTAEHPSGWVLYDKSRQRSPVVYAGKMDKLLRRSLINVANGPGETRLARFGSSTWRKTFCSTP